MLIDVFGPVTGEWMDGWFATPGQAVIDTIRLVILFAAFVFMFLAAVAVFLARSRTQRALLTANVMSGFLVIGVTYERLGDPATYQYLVVVALVGFGLWGSWSYLYGPNRLPAGARPRSTRFVRRGEDPPP